MILDEGTLIDISLNSSSYDSNSSTTDLYDNEKKNKKRRWVNKWCICFTATVIAGLTLTGLFLLEAFKETSK